MCETVSSTVAAVLIVVILFVLAYPQYAGETKVKGGSLGTHECVGETCDRLGLGYLFNNTNRSVEPCDNFYEHVCYRWNEGLEETPFVTGIVEISYSVIREKVYQSQLSTIVRNDVEQFASFLHVCLEDKSFDAPLSSWVKLIRNQFREDFPVLGRWDWARMIRAVIKYSLCNGLQTLLGIWVGRLRDKNRVCIVVDGSLWSQFDATPKDNDALKLMIVAITRELPEFRNLNDGVDKVNDIARDIYTRRVKNPPAPRFSLNISKFSKLIDAEVFIEEINRHVPHEMRVSLQTKFLTVPFLQPDQLFPTLESHAVETRALYINLLVLGEVLRHRYALTYQHKTQLRVCVDASRRVFRHTWAKLVVDVVNLRIEAKYLEHLFQDIREGIINHLEQVSSLSVAKLAVAALVNKTVLVKIEGANVTSDDRYGAQPLAVGYWMPQYLLQTMAFQANRSIGSILEIDSLTRVSSEFVLPSYDARQLSLKVPIFLLFRPLFFLFAEEQFHNFATVGVLLAETMIREAVRRSLVYPTGLRNPVGCRIDKYVAIRAAVDQERDRPTAEEVFIWNTALLSAFRGLQTYTRSKMSPIDIRKYQRELHQKFFERFCLLSCKFPNMPNITSMQRCTIPLMSMADFAGTYNCRRGSRMDQSHVCPNI